MPVPLSDFLKVLLAYTPMMLVFAMPFAVGLRWYPELIMLETELFQATTGIVPWALVIWLWPTAKVIAMFAWAVATLIAGCLSFNALVYHDRKPAYASA